MSFMKLPINTWIINDVNWEHFSFAIFANVVIFAKHYFG